MRRRTVDFPEPLEPSRTVHRPGLDRERDVIEGDAVAEPLGDVAKRDHRGAVRRGSALVSGRCRAPSARHQRDHGEQRDLTWISRRAVAISSVGGSSPDSASRGASG